MSFDKEWHLRAVNRRLIAFQNVARALGKEHPMVKMMGTLAWGRHQHEWGPDRCTLRNVVYAAGALDGMKDILNTWARDNDRKAQRVLLDEWDKTR